MKVKIRESVLKERLKIEGNFAMFELEADDISQIQRSEIMELITDSYYISTQEFIDDLLDDLTCSEKMGVIRHIKEKLTQEYNFKHELLEMLELLSYEERQEIIQELFRHYPSIEQCQKMHENLRLANEGGKDKQ